MVVAAIVLAGFAWWAESYQPPRKVIAEYEGAEFRLRDVVPYAVIDGAFTGSIDANRAANNMLRDHVVAARGPDVGVEVTQEDIDADLVRRYDLPGEDGEYPAQLTEEGRAAYDEFIGSLDRAGVSEEEYRVWQRGQTWIRAVSDKFGEDAPNVAESVYLEWIVAADSLRAQEARDRLDAREDFGAVASELNTDFIFSANDTGIVGWVPRGALTEMDALLFPEPPPTDDSAAPADDSAAPADDSEAPADDGEAPAAPERVLGEIQGPVALSIGSVVFRVTDASGEQPVSDGMRSLLGQNAFQDWLDEQTLALNFDGLSDDDIRWVIGALGEITRGAG